jgi:hypothetical protein
MPGLPLRDFWRPYSLRMSCCYSNPWSILAVRTHHSDGDVAAKCGLWPACANLDGAIVLCATECGKPVNDEALRENDRAASYSTRAIINVAVAWGWCLCTPNACMARKPMVQYQVWFCSQCPGMAVGGVAPWKQTMACLSHVTIGWVDSAASRRKCAHTTRKNLRTLIGADQHFKAAGHFNRSKASRRPFKWNMANTIGRIRGDRPT